jgi:hypothetical protein
LLVEVRKTVSRGRNGCGDGARKGGGRRRKEEEEAQGWMTSCKPYHERIGKRESELSVRERRRGRKGGKRAKTKGVLRER